MKLAPLLVLPVWSLEASSTAKNLITAVGHRNATHMEALIQGLADESVQVPGWKFDEDIRAALEAIRKVFVSNIQTALMDAHKHDQEHMNCETQTCFGGCIDNYKKGSTACNDLDIECSAAETDHKKCRKEVYSSYVVMAKSCANLHCFIKSWKDEDCMYEKCLCPDLIMCHKAGGGYDDECVAQLGDCKGELGGWLQVMIQKFKSGYATWSDYWSTCRKDYHYFLTIDMDCDSKQKKFESCKCKQRLCDHRACTVEFEQCQQHCWDIVIPMWEEKECLEKDRKIDWSATKKIQCYVDILLHDYNKTELLTRCGAEDCVNTVREEDYAECHEICLEVDHDGVWPEVHSHSLACKGDVTPYGAGLQSESQTVWIAGHHFRSYHDDHHLGDAVYKCDANGEEVFTRHRGGKANRAGEHRCTEHLDLDFQVPPCCECDDPREPVCDEKFHAKYYCEYDDTSAIGCITDCCSDCFGPVSLKSVKRDYSVEPTCKPCDGDCTTAPDCDYSAVCSQKEFTTLSIKEHTHAWAFNRCPCTECMDIEIDTYGGPSYTCGAGPHTIGGGGGAYGR